MLCLFLKVELQGASLYISFWKEYPHVTKQLESQKLSWGGSTMHFCGTYFPFFGTRDICLPRQWRCTAIHISESKVLQLKTEKKCTYHINICIQDVAFCWFDSVKRSKVQLYTVPNIIKLMMPEPICLLHRWMSSSMQIRWGLVLLFVSSLLLNPFKHWLLWFSQKFRIAFSLLFWLGRLFYLAFSLLSFFFFFFFFFGHLQDLNSLIRDQTRATAVKAPNLNYWITRESSTWPLSVVIAFITWIGSQY